MTRWLLMFLASAALPLAVASAQDTPSAPKKNPDANVSGSAKAGTGDTETDDTKSSKPAASGESDAGDTPSSTDGQSDAGSPPAATDGTGRASQSSEKSDAAKTRDSTDEPSQPRPAGDQSAPSKASETEKPDTGIPESAKPEGAKSEGKAAAGGDAAGKTAEAKKSGPDAWMKRSDWYTFNGDLMAQKYTEADQITPDNVGKLKKAWEFHTGDVSDGSGDKPMSVWSATPLFVNDTVYVGTPFYRIIALDPATGKQKWQFNPHAVLKALTQPDLKNRGVAYWQAENPDPDKACQKIVYIGTMDAKLYAVDADTGKPCQSFASNGMLDVNRWNTANNKWPLSLLQPPTIYHDTLYLGWAGKDWTDASAPPGTVFAVDARTGKLKWTFNALPKEVISKTGTANVWASMSIDPETGLLYLPISSPSPNFYGGDRKEKLPLTTSVTALNADTGKLVWSRQLVHHDIWDVDTDAPPTLVDLTLDDKKVPALVQSSKQGFLYVLNRKTGEPIFPITEKKVPQSDVPGEQASPTQPFVDKPEPVIPAKWPGVSRLADMVSFGQCSREAKKLRYDGKFTPPSLQGTLVYPPTTGGTEWGGGAVNPKTGTYVVNSNSVVQIYKLIKRAEYRQAEQNGETSGLYAQEGAPYGFQLKTFLNWAGMPCWKPPYGFLSAYDMNSGKLLWKKPFGQVQKWGFYMPKSWGSVTIGAPVISESGLIFIGASMDSRVRAIDLKSGKVLWRSLVDAPAVAMPAVYTYKGKEYVVFVAGGNSILAPKVSDQVVAYALPGTAE